MQTNFLPLKEQINRLRSANKNLQKFSSITDDNFSSAIQSAEYFFFVAGHMRDWFKESGFSQNVIDGYIRNSYELGVVRNLSLRLKHFKVTNPSSPQVIDIGIKRVPIGREWNGLENKAELMLPSDGKILKLLNFANSVVRLWENFHESYKDKIVLDRG